MMTGVWWDDAEMDLALSFPAQTRVKEWGIQVQEARVFGSWSNPARCQQDGTRQELRNTPPLI